MIIINTTNKTNENKWQATAIINNNNPKIGRQTTSNSCNRSAVFVFVVVAVVVVAAVQ